MGDNSPGALAQEVARRIRPSVQVVVRGQEDPVRRYVYSGQLRKLTPVAITLGFGQDLADPDAFEYVRSWPRSMIEQAHWLVWGDELIWPKA